METYLFCELGNDRQRWILVAGDVSPVRAERSFGEEGGERCRSHPLFVKSHKRFCGRLKPQSNIFIGAENALN
jgi:hypothetical protein